MLVGYVELIVSFVFTLCDLKTLCFELCFFPIKNSGVNIPIFPPFSAHPSLRGSHSLSAFLSYIRTYVWSLCRIYITVHVQMSEDHCGGQFSSSTVWDSTQVF